LILLQKLTGNYHKNQHPCNVVHLPFHGTVDNLT